MTTGHRPLGSWAPEPLFVALNHKLVVFHKCSHHPLNNDTPDAVWVMNIRVDQEATFVENGPSLWAII